MKSHKSLVRLWTGTLLTAIMRRSQIPAKRTLLVADEAAQLGEFDLVLTACTLLRGYGLQLITAWQDIAQIRSRYKLDYPTLLNNAAALISFGQSHYAAAKEYGELLGVDAAELLKTGVDQAALLIRGQGTRMIRRPNYLKDEQFSGLADPKTVLLARQTARCDDKLLPLRKRGLIRGTNWEQYWQRQPHATTMRKYQSGDVRALDSQTLGTTATCSQCDGYGRRPGLEIRSAQEGVGSVTFGTGFRDVLSTTRTPFGATSELVPSNVSRISVMTPLSPRHGTWPLLFWLLLGLLQERHHIAPQFLACRALGRQFGQGRRVADAGQVGVLLPVPQRLLHVARSAGGPLVSCLVHRARSARSQSRACLRSRARSLSSSLAASSPWPAAARAAEQAAL